jgi:hypothetical protein
MRGVQRRTAAAPIWWGLDLDEVWLSIAGGGVEQQAPTLMLIVLSISTPMNCAGEPTVENSERCYWSFSATA